MPECARKYFKLKLFQFYLMVTLTHAVYGWTT